MKYILTTFLVGMFLITFVGSYDYTADSYLNVTLVLDEEAEYVVDSYLNVTLVLNEKAPITDSCTYTSGTWEVQFIDNCSIETNVDLVGEDLTLHGDVGRFDIRANIINFGQIVKHGDGEIAIWSGGSITQ